MPSFENNISSNKNGRALQCLVDVIVNKSDGQRDDSIEIRMDSLFPALIDTGATNTCIRAPRKTDKPDISVTILLSGMRPPFLSRPPLAR